jgi:hypothetical protein
MRYTLESTLPLGAFEHCGDRRIKLYGGGGGFIEDVVGGISDAVSSVGDFVGDAVSGIGDVLASVDPGPMIGDVGATVDDAVGDVIPGGWATVGAVATAVVAPELAPFLFEEGAATFGAEEIAANLAAEDAALGQAMTEFANTPELGDLGASLLDQTAEGLAKGDISGLTSNATDMMLNGNPSLNAIDIANASADPIQTLNAANNWTGPMTNNIGTLATEMAAQGVPENVIADHLMQTYGIDQYAAANAAGIAMEGGTAEDIANVLAQDYGENMTGLEEDPYNAVAKDPTHIPSLKDLMPYVPLAGLGARLLGGNTTRAPSDILGNLGNLAKPLAKTASLSDMIGGGGSSSGGGAALPGNLQATMLTSNAAANANMNLNQLKQLYPQLSTVDPRILSTLTGKGASQSPSYYNYGSDATTGLMSAPKAGAPSPGYPSQASAAPSSGKFMGTSPLASGSNALASAGLRAITEGALPGSQTYGLKAGGGVHRPEFITGSTGHFVQGRGDGQSDDIPAMLADGEYVFDADTVAALGNGSSKAGAVQLDKMREAIRKHKRSAAHNKIPPKAKSPLDYLKG